MTGNRMTDTVRRFSANQRFQHALIMVAFVALVVTGVPQRFSDYGWSQWVIQNLGGIYTMRLIHRGFGFVFTAAAIYHLAFIFHHVFVRKQSLSMLFAFKDFVDAVGSLRYELGLTARAPRFGRFDFRQKFEYWGMVFGGAVMIGTGLMLMYPTWVTRLLPGEFIPAAKMMHGYEGLMALLIIIVWHMYSAHIGPEKFPLDTAIFTGRISRERMRAEHPVEYEDLLETEGSGRPDGLVVVGLPESGRPDSAQ